MSKPTLIIPIGHTNTVTSATFSPDGKWLLTGSLDQTVKLWDRRGRELMSFSEGAYFVNDVDFAPHGRLFVTASTDKNVKIWDLYTGEVIRRLEGHEKAVYAVAYSPDGKRLLTGSGDGTAALWNASRGNRQAVLEGHEGSVRAVAFSPDGETVLTGGEDAAALLWNVRTRKQLLALTGHAKSVLTVAFSPDGQLLLTGSADGSVRLWDRETGEQRHVWEKSKKGVRSAVFSPDGRHVLIAGEDGRAVVWAFAADRQVQVLKGHRSTVNDAIYAPDGQTILTASRDRTARLWDVRSGKTLVVLEGHAMAVTDVDFSSDESKVLTGTEGNTATIWDMAKGRTTAVLEGHEETINTVVFSPDDHWVLTASDDGTARIWDTGTGEQRRVLTGHEKGVKSAAFAADGRQVVTAAADKSVKRWDAATGQCLATYEGHHGAVNDVVFSPEGRRLLSGSSDRTARIWEVESGETLQILEGHEKNVRSVAFSPDGRRVLTGSYDKTARIWNADTGELITELTGHQYDIRSVAFSPDGRRALTGSYDETAKVWDVETGECLLTLEGHHSAPRSVAFSAGGHHLLTGSRDNMVKIWDAGTGRESITLIQINREDWVVTTPSGLFDASPDAMELMYYVAPYADGKETEWVVIELDQLKERYYEPGLLSKIMGFRKGDIRDVDRFEQVELFPHLEATWRNDRLWVRLTERNGGLGRLSLFINHKEVREDVNPQRKKSLLLSLQPYRKYFYPDSPSTIGLLAYNEEGWLRGEMLELPYPPVSEKGAGTRGGKKPKEEVLPQTLHAIVIGTSRYDARGIRDLNFPDKDAVDMALAVQLAGGTFFPGPVQLHLLTSNPEAPARLATKDNIRKAFAIVAERAAPQDVLLIYLSGHGATHGGGDRSQFYYLTRDLPGDNLHDPGVRRLGAISSAEFTDWIREIPAGKQVFILDTCHAGKIVDHLSGGRSMDNAVNIRALDRMKDRMGLFVLAGSAADHFSYEASIFGQGLLTYSLLLGMKGGALEEDLVDVSRLFQFARNKVPEFAETIYQQQEPVVAIPRGGDSFYLGRADQRVREKIRIAEPKPVVTASILLDGEFFDDGLHLSEKLDGHFRTLHARGKEAPFVFLDVPGLDIAYYVRGLYTRDRSTISLRGRVFRAGRAVGDFSATSPEEEEGQLIRKISAEVIAIVGREK